MGNFSTSDENEKLEKIGKQIILWHKACMSGLDNPHLLKEPRPMIGAILFFLGSIDNLCQANDIDDQKFAKLGLELLDIMGFPKEVTATIFKNFYTQKIENKFALYANIEGGKTITEFLSGENKIAPLAFGAFVEEWGENPDLEPREISLFGI